MSSPLQLGQYCSILIVDTPSELTVNWILSNIGNKEKKLERMTHLRDGVVIRFIVEVCSLFDVAE